MSVETPEAPEITHTCPRCGAEYAGGDGCPSCGLLRDPLPCDDGSGGQARYRCVLCERLVCGAADPGPNRPGLCEQHASTRIIENWAQVYSTGDTLEAGLIAQNLEAEGIDAQVYDQKDDYVFPVDFGELSVARVMVPVWEYANALAVIQSYMDSSGEVVFACPACGEVYEPGQTQCTNCGASLVETSA